MFIASFASLPTPGLRAFYERKRAKGGRHNAAVMCLTRGCAQLSVTLRNRTPCKTPEPTTDVAKAAWSL